MRADTLVKFITAGEMQYDENTGDYVQSEDSVTEVHAYVTDTGTERMNVLYAGIRRDAKTIRVNGVIDQAFDHIEIDGKRYKSDNRRIYRHKTVLEVSGV